jgi:hypothetical protein
MARVENRVSLLLGIGVIMVALAAFLLFAGSKGAGGGVVPTGAGATGAHPTSTLKPTSTLASTSTADQTPSPTPSPIPSTLPSFGHVFVIVMENEEARAIIGNNAAPYIKGLANQYGFASNYTAVGHRSEPNYLALWSGSTQGVTDDGIYNFASGTTLADQIEASGRSWHVAAQNVPLGCYTGATASNGADGTGTYARKHEPAISWTSVSRMPTRCSSITDFSHFDPTVGNFWFIVPNLCNDMHDCSIATGDTFLKGFMPKILTSSAFANSVVFLTWDEGTTTTGGGGVVATIVISPLGKPAFVSSTSHSHYSLLRTIENAWEMPCLANTCSANDLAEFFP